MLKKIEYLIPAAMSAIEEVLKREYDSKRSLIPEGYQAAASGFAITLRQMSLLPTLAVYTDNDNKAEINRKLLLETLLYIVKHADSKYGRKEDLPKADKQAQQMMADKILRHMVENKSLRAHFSDHLVLAATAFKLAIRTYPLKTKKAA